MPYIIRPKGVMKIAASLFGSMLLIGAAPAAASAACPSSPASTALSQFGDNALYSLLPGCSFESGAPGWSLSNADVEEGEGANGGQYLLSIEPDGSAVSPTFCVSSDYPSFRFFASQTGGGTDASLRVRLRWSERFSGHRETTVASLQPGSSWTLSPVLQLAGALPLWMPGSSLQVKMVFQPSGGGAYGIDDVYIDPYSR